MRKFIPLLLLGIISCSDKDTPEPELLEVTSGSITIDKPLHAIDDSIMVAIEYSVFPGDVIPEITISCNNKMAYALDTVIFEERRMATAWLPPAGKTGENEVVINIHSGNKEFVFKKPFRVIENNNLQNWWPAMDYETLEKAFPMYYEIGQGAVSGGGSVDGRYKNISIGYASKQYVWMGELYKKRTLINGIYGKYFLDYDDDKKLEKVTIENGNMNIDARFTFDGVLEGISRYYGAPVEVQDGSHARFEVGNYVVYVTKTPGADIFTEITLK